jgi:hypothetical protein
MKLQFKKASKSQSKLRLALMGVSGSGKTYSALRIAKAIAAAGKGRIAVIDTERGSASKYSGDVANFDVLELETFSPAIYVEAIQAADAEGYDVLIIDSMSHAWMGKEGALEQVDKASKRSQSGNTFMAWRDVTPMHNALIDAILACRAHVIATIRVKTAYELEENARGKKEPKRIGLAPVQREGLEYEFDVVADIDHDHNMLVSKTRCAALDKAVINKPGDDVAAILLQWLTDGAPAQRSPFDELVDTIRAASSLAEHEKAAELARARWGRLTGAQRQLVTEDIKLGKGRIERAADDAREAAAADEALRAQEAAAAAAGKGEGATP